MKNTVCKTIAAALIMLIASTSFASEVCFDDKAGHDSIKSQLPKIMQSSPLYLAHLERSSLTGAMKISWDEREKAFKLEFYGYHSFVGNRSESGLIHEICYNAETESIRVTDVDGDAKDLQLVGNNSVTIRGFKFTKVDDTKAYDKIVTRVKQLTRVSLQ